VQQGLDQEQSKHGSLAQQNGFGPAFWQRKLTPKKKAWQNLTLALLIIAKVD
jgi:hypothetical protein